MKLSVCLNAVGDYNRIDAMRLARDIGYTAVEFWEGSFPLDEYKAGLDEAGLALACMGGAGNLVDASKRSEFIESLKASLANAKALGAQNMIAIAGQELDGVPRDIQMQSIVDGLKEAAKLLSDTNITLVLEPLNVLVDHKGYFLYRSSEAFEITRAVNSPNVKILFDIYHQQISEGNLIANITNNIDQIGHFHIAGNPGRGEPYLGEINYREVLRAIDETGYSGYVGLEYWAKRDSVEEALKRCLSDL